MDDPRVLRIITVGLVLAAIAVGYFLLTGGLSPKPKKVQTQATQVYKAESPTPSESPVLSVQSSPSSTNVPSAYNTLAQRNQSNVQTLPATGFPAGLVLVFSVSAIVSGWSLRKYPH